MLGLINSSVGFAAFGSESLLSKCFFTGDPGILGNGEAVGDGD